MDTATKSSATTLTITKTIPATRERVFKAWTDPTALMQWFAPSDDFSVPLAEVDLRVGGRFRIEMKAPDGQSHSVVGMYQEILAPERLVFTWAWEAGGGCGGGEPGENVETLVTVAFVPRGTSTELTLTHECFPNGETRDRHAEGWSGCLARLERMV